MTTYDRLIFGMKCLNVSQIGSGYDGKNHYSHVSYEVDLAGMDSGVDVWRNKMPNTLWYCAGAWGTSSTGNTRFFWSYGTDKKPKKVLCSDGALRYITLALTHSNKSYSVGKYYSADEIMYQEGTSGYATGNHIHLEVCAGHIKTKTKNSKGGYNLANMLRADKCFFLLNGYSYIKNGGGLNWKTTSTVPYTVNESSGSTSSSSEGTIKHGFVKGYGKGKKMVTKVALNMRSDASTKSSIVKTLSKGTTLTYYGYYAYNIAKNGGGTTVWYRVTDGKTEGYVSSGAKLGSGTSPYLTNAQP